MRRERGCSRYVSVRFRTRIRRIRGEDVGRIRRSRCEVFVLVFMFRTSCLVCEIGPKQEFMS